VTIKTALGTPSSTLENRFFAIVYTRAQFLGFVEVPDRRAAEAAAAEQFNISEERRTRLVVQERG
jgi:hypothetical protein